MAWTSTDATCVLPAVAGTMGDARADVLIIGAGAAGGVAGRRLAEAGFHVVCLEQGGWPDHAAFPGATPEWELVAAKQWSSVPSVRNAPADYPLDLTRSDQGVVNFNGVGGGTVLYAAQWPRMLPDDFRVRSVDGVADDWPIGYDELLPYYEQTDREFGVSGLGGNPCYPPGADPPLPPLPIHEAGLRVARAHARLGWHWWPQSNAILSAAYDGRHPCVQRGTCGSGCNEGAKASTDLTHWPRVVARGGAVVTGARARRIVVDRAGLATGAEWVDVDGNVHFQSADVVLCAANAIGTARLLLASADDRRPDGLANSSGLVGRRLMLHPLSTVTGVFEDRLEGWRAHAGGLVQCLEFARSDPARGFVRGALWELGSSGGPLRALFTPSPSGVWGREHHRHVRERLGHTAQWAILCEDLPDDANHVELSASLTDSSGIPAPVVTYRLSENTVQMMEWQAARASESLEAAGAWKTEAHHRLANGHFMGTARMGADASSSVVDPWCITHDIPNLGIIDGSVFVTAGSANPTSTIAALAARAADRLVERRREMRVPARPVSFSGFAPVGTPVAERRSATITVAPRHAVLSAAERAVFASLADALIPAGDGMPAASEIAVQDALLDRVLRARPDLVPPLRAVLARPVGHPEQQIDLLESLASSDPAGLRALRWAVAGAYYLDTGVRARLDYPGTEPHPVRALEFPEYLAEGLLDHLLDTDPV